MRQVKRWRYYCDFCNKGGGQKHAMAKHEKGCTLNHDRICGLCDKGELSQQPFSVLLEAYKDGGLDKLRDITENCPACILTTIRANHNPKEDVLQWDNKFDFKKELEEFWQRVNDDDIGPGWEGE